VIVPPSGEQDQPIEDRLDAQLAIDDDRASQ